MRQFLPMLVAMLLLGGCSFFDENSRLASRCAKAVENPEAAATACTKLIDDPQSPADAVTEALFNRANARERLRNLPGAIEDMKRVVERDTAHVHAYAKLSLAFLYGTNGDMDSSRQLFGALLAADPDDVDTLTGFGVTLDRANEPEEALIYIDRALAINPDIWPAASERCWILGVLNRDLERALTECNRVLAAHPQDYNSYNSRGFVNFRLERYSDSVADYSRAIEGDPQSASSFYMRGMAKHALKRHADGDADIAKGRALNAGVVERYAGFGVKPPQ